MCLRRHIVRVLCAIMLCAVPQAWARSQLQQVDNDHTAVEASRVLQQSIKSVDELLDAHTATGDEKNLEAARRAADILFQPLEQGGLLFSRGDDIWFEEVPVPMNNPPHVLEGHLRALIALRKLAKASGDAEVNAWYRKGLAALARWLPKYDAGYWLRSDLNPKKEELLFRFTNPYGVALEPLAIDSVTLRDPKSGAAVSVDLGAESDSEGGSRFAGVDWSQSEQLDGRSMRRLLPVTPEDAQIVRDGGMYAPHTYVYLTLPGEWRDNLRDEPYELEVVYKDDNVANVAVQMRSIAPGTAFHDLRGGDLLCTGSGTWRTWKILVRPSDLGFYVGEDYARRHADYLDILAEDEELLQSWAYVAKGYVNWTKFNLDAVQKKDTVSDVLPLQTYPFGSFGINSDGVVLQFNASSECISVNSCSIPPKPIFSPYLIGCQALRKLPLLYGNIPKEIMDNQIIVPIEQFGNMFKPEAAYRWLAQHAVSVGSNALTWQMSADNTYNDVFTKAPWQSAFGQPYVLDALSAALAENRTEPDIPYKELLDKGLNAYAVPVAEGGLHDPTRMGMFFEEVPNATHILNGHLTSLNVLARYGRKDLAEAGTRTLLDSFHLYDTGAWLRYDANPKKHFLLQLDWLEGEASPLVGAVAMVNPATMTATVLDAAADISDDAPTRLSGFDWLSTDSNIVGRPFRNGYAAHETAQPEKLHNVYIRAALPETTTPDHFDWPEHLLVIRYYDAAPGLFALKIQPIFEGNRLVFRPLRNGLLRCVGDKAWKIAVFTLRPQDLGWFVGIDYQDYHQDQLEILAKATGDALLAQWVERLGWYRFCSLAGESPIRFPGKKEHAAPDSENIAAKAEVASDCAPADQLPLLVDGDPQTGAELRPVNGEVTLRLHLGRKASIRALALDFADALPETARLDILATDWRSPSERGNVYETFVRKTVVPGNRFQLPLRPAKEAACLWLRLSGLTDSVTLRDIRCIADQPTAEQALLLQENLPFLEKDDAQNPLFIFNKPIPQSIKDYADALLAGKTLTDHEKVVLFMSQTRDHATGLSKSGEPREVLLAKIGACGTWSNILAAFCAVAGIPARYANMYNFPPNNGHTAIEAFVDGRWQFYDPTYELFYTTTPDDTKHPYVLSFDELRRSRHREAGVTRIVGNAARLARSGAFAVPEIYEQSNPAGVIGPDHPMLFPLSLSPGESIEKSEFGPKRQGAAFIGKAYLNVHQEFHLSGLESGRNYLLAVRYANSGGAEKSDALPLHAASNDVDILSGQDISFTWGQKDMLWQIRFRAKAETGSIRLTHDIAKRSYLSAERYSLEPAD